MYVCVCVSVHVCLCMMTVFFCVSVGCGQSSSPRVVLLQNRDKPYPPCPTATKGKAFIGHPQNTHLDTSRDVSSVTNLSVVAIPLQIMTFFEFNERLEAILTKAYIYR